MKRSIAICAAAAGAAAAAAVTVAMIAARPAIDTRSGGPMQAETTVSPFAAVAFAQTPPQAARDTIGLRAEIEKQLRGMEGAVARGDLLAAAQFYSDDAVVRTSRSVIAQGRAGVDRYFQSIGNAKSWNLSVTGVGGSRNNAWQTGRSILVHGTGADTSVVDFLVVWTRQPAGDLRISLDYFHSAPR